MNDIIKNDTAGKKNGNFTDIIFAIIFVILIFTGLFYTVSVWFKTVDETTENAMKTAMLAEAGIPKSNINRLSEDMYNIDVYRPEYRELKSNLAAMVKLNDNMRFTYIIVKINGQICFLADSEPETSNDYSPPGQVYTEADENIFMPFENKQVSIFGPVSDRWGEWYAVLVPMFDERTGDVIALFGTDYPAESWYVTARKRTVETSIIVLCLNLIGYSIYNLYQKNGELREEKRKLTELDEKLKKQEVLFRTIFEQAPVGIAIVNDLNFPIIMNPAFEKIMMRSKDELFTLSITDITYSDDRAGDIEKSNEFRSGDIDNYSLFKRFVRPDGKIVWVYMIVVRLDYENIENTNEQHHLCIIEDVNELIKVQDALRESERSRLVLLDNLPGTAYKCLNDKIRTLQFISKGCFDIFGYSSEKMLDGMSLYNKKIVNKEYREYLSVKWEEALRQKKKFKEEYEVIDTNGKYKWVFEQGQGIYNENGMAVATEGLIIDIDERKKREIEIKYLYSHDRLTGLYNRGYFEEQLKLADNKRIFPVSVLLCDINGVRLINEAFGHEKGDTLIKNTAEILRFCCRETDIIARIGGDEFGVLMPDTANEAVIYIINKIKEECEAYNKRNSKNIYSMNISMGYSIKTSAEDDMNTVYKLAENYMYKRKLLESKSSHSAIITSIMATMFAKSQETEQHAERLADLSKRIGSKLNLPSRDIDLLVLLSMLHDIGKIGIDDSILNKPGPLNEQEMNIMKKHPEIGYRIAMSLSELNPIAEYILNYHERWDGGGYPQGLKGDEIPLLSRILSIADAYDAMTKNRIYRKAMTKEAAVEEIKRNAGTQFDPAIVKIFLEIMNE